MRPLPIIASIVFVVVVLAGSSFFLVGAALGSNANYDTDGDGLIEITNLEQLNAIRYDMNGDGVPDEGYEAFYFRAFTGATGSACGGNCAGYELSNSLDFLDPGSYASGAVNNRWTTGMAGFRWDGVPTK